jgi:hypothetical protein
MLGPTFYILALFLGISVVMGVLLAVHDGVEAWLTRRERRHSGNPGGGRPLERGVVWQAPAGREPRPLTVVVTRPLSGGAAAERPAVAGAGERRNRELPGRYRSAGQDAARR